MEYVRCGKSGLKLPMISLGLWHNFGHINSIENQKQMILKAFDLGITHFDIANNYGPPSGAAEENFGQILNKCLLNHRDEMVISTKAGHYMWEGPYGDWGSRKHLIGSINQSLKRLKLDYVDIFYHHRPDPETPIEETMMALHDIVKQGKALYIGLSKYNEEDTKKAAAILRELKTPCIIHQDRYSILERKIDQKLIPIIKEEGMGLIVFRPLAQGLLTEKYLSSIPKDSRAAGPSEFLKEKDITEELLIRVQKLSKIAKNRGQSLAQMALSFILRDNNVTSALIGASKTEQIEENVAAIAQDKLLFTKEEIDEINSLSSLSL